MPSFVLILLNVKLDLDKTNELSDLEIKDLNEKISRIEQKAIELIPSYFDFLTEQTDKGNYIEIHLPIFEYDITLMISKINKNFLISVLNHDNSIVYGNLILDNYPCVSLEEIKKLKDWTTFNEKKTLRIFKPL